MGGSGSSVPLGNDVRSGSETDFDSCERHFRFIPNSRHSSVQLECPRTAMNGRSDLARLHTIEISLMRAPAPDLGRHLRNSTQ